MTSKRLNILALILYSYILYHLIYGIYAFKFGILSGITWLSLALGEILIVYLGYKYSRFLQLVLIIILIIQSLFSLTILLAGKDVAYDHADCVLVIGDEVKDGQLTPELKERLDVAFAYSLKNPTAQFILSGGKVKGSDIAVAKAMQNYLSRKGVAVESWLLDEATNGLKDSIANARPFLTNAHKILLIANDYQLLRAKQIAAFYGYKLYTYGTSSALSALPNALLKEKFFLLWNLMNKG